MATTRIMPLHIGKSRTESQAISDIIDYVENPQKTDNRKLITAMGVTADRRCRVPVSKTAVHRRTHIVNYAKTREIYVGPIARLGIPKNSGRSMRKKSCCTGPPKKP